MEIIHKILKPSVLLCLTISVIYPLDNKNLLKTTTLFENNYQKETLPASILTDSLSSRANIFWGEKGLIRKLNFAPKDLQGEMTLRKNMLQWHQRLGLITLGAITYQFFSGKKQYSNNFENFTTERQKRHKLMGYTTYGLYLSTASLSLLAPPARKQSIGLSSTKIHKYLALIHFSAMVAQPWLGYKAANATNADDYDKYIKLHNTMGTVTMFSFSLSFITTLFP